MERKRTIAWDDPRDNVRDAALISGLDYLKAIKDGKISPPPIALLIGYKICEVDAGYAVFELYPGEYHYNPFGTVHGGIISTILDSTLTSSVLSTLGKGETCSTAEMKVNFIRTVTVGTGTLRCEARTIHVGRRLATAEGNLKDKKDKLYAHAVGTCLIFTPNSFPT